MTSEFAQRLASLRMHALQHLGRDDVRHLLRVHRVSLAFGAAGRLLLLLGFGPASFVLGTLCVAVYKQLQNAEIGHMALHGVYDRFVELPSFHRAKFYWRAPIHEESWVRMHNSCHHPFTSVAGKDPDLHFGPVRLCDQTPWAPYHRANVLLMLAVHGFHMSLTTLYYSGLLHRVWPTGGRDARELRLEKRDLAGTQRGALRKLVRHATVEYVALPLLAGPCAGRVLLGNWLSSRLRDAFTSTSILVNHVGAGAARYAETTRAADRSDWYRMQIEASRNLRMPHWLSVLTGGLDCHIEHHLFPDLPANRLRELSQQVESLCREHGVTYRKHSWPVALWQAWRELGRLSAAPRARAAQA